MGCTNSKSNVKLNDEDIQFLMKNTNYSEKEIRDWYKGFQVDCPNGKLSKDKFIEIYKVFFKGGNPEKFCQHVYRTFDEDGNGWIDFKEFLLAIGITTSTNPKEKLKWAFKMYDINNDGLIELDEMTKIIKVFVLNSDPGRTVSHFVSSFLPKETFFCGNLYFGLFI